MNIRKNEGKKQKKKTPDTRGKNDDVKKEEVIKVVSLDPNKRVAEKEDKPLSSVTGISTTESESVYFING